LERRNTERGKEVLYVDSGEIEYGDLEFWWPFLFPSAVLEVGRLGGVLKMF
jgi:hypothetical protein